MNSKNVPSKLDEAYDNLLRLYSETDLWQFKHDVILYGSRARGRGNPNSDWDFVIFTEALDFKFEERHLHADVGLDVLVIPLNATMRGPWSRREIAMTLLWDGLWLRDGKWQAAPVPHPWSIDQQGLEDFLLRRARRHLKQLCKSYHCMPSSERQPMLTRARRFMQRALIYQVRRDVPSTPEVDADWMGRTHLGRELVITEFEESITDDEVREALSRA